MSATVRNLRGFTLIEMIITIVVIGVALSGILVTFNTVVRSSADPLVSKQMISIAEAEMEGVMLQNFAAIASPTGCNTCPAGYTGSTTVTSGVTWQDIPDTKTIVVTIVRGTQTFQLTNHRTNYAP
jgi:prepilin-type N-terminal cleavage/methylation domain-containing protein